MSLKIMHTGDVHLGMKFNQYPQISSDLEEARYQALENVIKAGNQRNVNLLAIAGDLFDKASIKSVNIKKTIAILDKFAGDAVLILPGNHDYSDGITALWDQFKKNIKGRMLILDQEKIYDLHDFGISAAVYPAPCDSKLSSENKLGWIKNLSERPAADYHLALAHGALAGFSPDLNDDYFKMTKEELLDLEMDLWLLGHSHLPYPEMKNVKMQKIFNNGTPEPDGMDCRHQGSAWYIELDEENQVQAERIRTGNYHFSDLEKIINSQSELENLVNQILSFAPENKILRLKLKGELPRDDFTVKDKYLSELRDNCFYAKIDQSALNIKIDQDLIKEEFVENSFPHQLLSELEDNKQAQQLAYKMLKEVQQ
ncbi:DNA repair exonuclease SbcCD nuclease subunit [Halanaerobium saccharolyticum]|uniref:DNA repair exonuclease SbcCD nuclease subunit n=1 Tax=Halanaerobium saccharolyticum TaxID=43595 RepID=A0A4R7YSR2_9FIRM|nr:DNA repair exonuclease [Halanaerobium saccharolyticum]RAK05048.1 DNA repair exonuclease SbcCD nuclease subunit [Halanaerobium saccharolyticum]TDV98834.1 DNA repair exonuclease SbcCD nuclease subunit [Halanaerobium saccharolyticum]TDX51485.1 DNA repair exonuclease SbcCD nuclease subunit [Halanaerobium saccharolyticum]